MSPKPGDLKVWWIPQVPGKTFEVRVENLAEARLLLDVHSPNWKRKTK